MGVLPQNPANNLLSGQSRNMNMASKSSFNSKPPKQSPTKSRSIADKPEFYQPLKGKDALKAIEDGVKRDKKVVRGGKK